MQRTVWTLTILAAVGGWLVYDARAAVVTGPSQTELEAAVRSGEPVAFAFDGTIALTNALLIVTNTTIDATGRSVILDAQYRSRHFVVTNGATLRLRNLVLANGAYYAADTNGAPGRPAWGGSIVCSGGELELVSCTLSNNATLGSNGTEGGPAGGGAIYGTDAKLLLTDCLLTWNRVTGGHSGVVGLRGGAGLGGALYATNSSCVLTQVIFSHNFAFGGESAQDQRTWPGGPGYGGGMAQAGGTGLVRRCSFVENTSEAAGYGSGGAGALYHHEGLIRIEQSCFSTNVAIGGEGRGGVPQMIYAGNAMGGAILNQTGRVELVDSALVWNRARGGDIPSFSFLTIGRSGEGQGGGIWNRGELLVVNSTIAENTATSGIANGPTTGRGGAAGGGIYGDATLVNVTLARNEVQPTGTASAWGSSVAGDIVITNSILFCSSRQTNLANIYGGSAQVTDGGHNLCSDESAPFPSTGSVSGVDPLLAPVADNGGLTPTVAFSPNSPALNAADPRACPLTDQRGVPRPSGHGCDIGAFELAPILTLARSAEGLVSVVHVFEPGLTNRLDAGTDLIHWTWRDTRVANAQGETRFEENAADFTHRFYQVRETPGAFFALPTGRSQGDTQPRQEAGAIGRR